ncbi:hypothetical protein G9C98_006616 [Cotesia typhae]|uniref:C2H2-type domain-containing protein n=1 Tax=Cotesia typhae TaxID=2053667 RepID=A0A8J5RF24_9HYME|nr:hypothetical protein G9C98_006616 [Cotesia typhae]
MSMHTTWQSMQLRDTRVVSRSQPDSSTGLAFVIIFAVVFIVLMEYGIWGLHAASRLWGDPRLARHPILPATPQILSRAVLTLSALQQQQQLSAAMASEADGCQAIELTAKPSNPGEESDTGSTNSSHPSGNNNLPSNFLDPMSCFGFDKDETVTPMLNSWVLGAYTAMLGRLSAATAALEAIEVPSMPSGSESESDESSSTEKSRDTSPVAGGYRGYPCGSCDVVAPTRPALKKHLLDCHPASSSGSEASSTRTCPSAGCDFTSQSRCEMETHVAGHVAQGMTPTGKKRSLALQRVRYRYSKFIKHFYSKHLLSVSLIMFNIYYSIFILQWNGLGTREKNTDAHCVHTPARLRKLSSDTCVLMRKVLHQRPGSAVLFVGLIGLPRLI